ncbi:MAG: TIR domain-containing protein [Anaerolineae bacterium]|nr:TIR domain-containing protein [Anaerolineae bacterium]
MQSSYDVFISYSHHDRDWVWDWLLPRLETAGISVCIDERDFEIGVPSLVNMEHAVERSGKTLLVITPAWINSEWTAFESLLVQGSDPAGRRARMIPLVREQADLPARIKMLTYVDFTREQNWDKQLARLIGAFGKTPLPAAAPVSQTTAPATAAPTQPVIAIDFAHNQQDNLITGWDGYYAAINEFAATLPDVTWTNLMPGQTFSANTLKSLSAVIVATPFHTILTDQEIENVRKWVQAGGRIALLASYTADLHHLSNLNALARTLGFEFVENLVLPPDVATDHYARVQARSQGEDRRLIVVANPPGGPLGAHPLLNGVKQVGFLSACGIVATITPECFITHTSGGVMQPYGPKDPRGWMQQIVEWKKINHEQDVTLFAAWTRGKGKIIAVGSWKLVLPNLTNAPDLDNAKLFQNMLRWLVN